jgi:hypothetical protein
MTELIVHGQARTVDISGLDIQRFAGGQAPGEVLTLCDGALGDWMILSVELDTSDRFRAAPDNGQHRRAVLGRHAVEERRYSWPR